MIALLLIIGRHCCLLPTACCGACRHVGCLSCSQVAHSLRPAGTIVACALAVMVQPTSAAVSLGLVSYIETRLFIKQAGMGENCWTLFQTSREIHSSSSSSSPWHTGCPRKILLKVAGPTSGQEGWRYVAWEDRCCKKTAPRFFNSQKPLMSPGTWYVVRRVTLDMYCTREERLFVESRRIDEALRVGALNITSHATGILAVHNANTAWCSA